MASRESHCAFRSTSILRVPFDEHIIRFRHRFLHRVKGLKGTYHSRQAVWRVVTRLEVLHHVEGELQCADIRLIGFRRGSTIVGANVVPFCASLYGYDPHVRHHVRNDYSFFNCRIAVIDRRRRHDNRCRRGSRFRFRFNLDLLFLFSQPRHRLLRCLCDFGR